jgi:quinol monooxygenase YgiN
MSLFIFVRFEPRPGKENELRELLRSNLEPTRAEPGCVRINLYESIRGPRTFFIHSEFLDEAAFEVHAEMPHIVRFLGLVVDLITHPLEVIRTEQIG